MAKTTFQGVVRSYGGANKHNATPGVMTQSVQFSCDPTATGATNVRIGTDSSAGQTLTLPAGAIVLSVQTIGVAAGGTNPTIDIGSSADPDGIVNEAPVDTAGEITGANGALCVAGGLAAAMSTADGLLLAIANALSHDLYYKIIDPKADTKTRLIVARVLLVLIGAAGAFVASLKLTSILGAVAWAFCFANSGLFFPLILGVWWKRANRAGAIAGMVGGFGAGAWYLYMVQFAGMAPWLGIDGLRFGMIGMPVSLILMIVVSLMTEEPDAETQKMVDDIRIPKGKTILGAEH